MSHLSNHHTLGLYSLSDLGISCSQDAEGKESLSIDLETLDSSGRRCEKLVFNPATKTWSFASKLGSAVASGSLTKQSFDGMVFNGPNDHDWTDNLPNTEHVKFFRGIDWATTPLGSLSSWPLSLQTFVTFMMHENTASAIYWGPNMLGIYNEAMISIATGRLEKDRDLIMGRTFEETWSEVWDHMKPLLDDVAKTGIPIEAVDVSLFPDRDGRSEETFWVGSFWAIRSPHSKHLGYYNRGREITKEVISERRTKTLNEIAASSEKEGEYVWTHLFNAFRDNERDFPMAFAYSATEDPVTGRCKLELKESIGIPQSGHNLVPGICDLYEAQSGFFPYYRRAKSLDKPLLLHALDGTFPEELLVGFEWQGFGEASRSVAFIAIRSSGRMLGILVIGLNPRRPYDAEYEGFLNSLSRHCSATIVNATDREETKLREERLIKQLADSESQIRNLAVYGPVGMVRIAINGKISWANDQFYEITGHGRKDEDQYELSFVDVVDPEDQPISAGNWPLLIENHQKIDVALRLKKKWIPPTKSEDSEAVEEPVWVHALAYPIIEEGEVKGVAAAVYDISHFKWAEATQRRNALAAKEAKRLQENFIDIVSHEMRNPLSAITQLADEITTSLDDFPVDGDLTTALDIVKFNITSAQTILLCTAHQKRIVDDVLTLSKLDAMMLSITPVVVRPLQVVETVAKMFEQEAITNKIRFDTALDETYSQLQIDWVYIDPSRLSQILINLIGNAIKFTKLEDMKTIRILIGARNTRPTSLAGVTWFPTHKKYRDPTIAGHEWGNGEQIYLCFQITDTGRGLEKDEMNNLFNRFQQATAKTHIKYGGSGLGLFISRELTETQGGEIGVESQPGIGSTFAFYIKGRRASAPAEPASLLPPSIPTHMRRVARTNSTQKAQHATDAKVDPPIEILLVEDNIVNAQVLTRQLEKSNVRVHLANHGVEALEFLQTCRGWRSNDQTTTTTDTSRIALDAKHPTVDQSYDKQDTANIRNSPPTTMMDSKSDSKSNVLNSEPNKTIPPPPKIDLDFILMDVEMPIMDGLTCTRRIRQLESEGIMTKHVNIIAITANARREQILTVLSAGADDVMPKPFRVKELLDKMAEIRRRQEQKRAGKKQG